MILIEYSKKQNKTFNAITYLYILIAKKKKVRTKQVPY